MILRWKILTIMLLLSTIMVSLFYNVSTSRLQGDYNQLEEDLLLEKVSIIEKEIKGELAEMSVFAYTLSASNETYRFVKKINPTYIEMTLCGSTFEKGNINIITILNARWEVIEEVAYDLDTGYFMAYPKSFENYTRPGSPLLALPDVDSKVEGLVDISGRTMLVVSRPITTFEGRGSINGTLIVGRYLDEGRIDNVVGSDANVTLGHASDIHLTDDFKASLPVIITGIDIVTKTRNDNRISGYAYFKDITGEPALLIRVDQVRKIQAIAEKSSGYLLLSSFSLGIVLCLASFLFLDYIVVSRMTRLSSEVMKIRRNDDRRERVKVEGGDEISLLATEINAMLESVDRSEKSMRESERMATLGKTTAMVGHDLRNPLQVIVSAVELTRKRLREISSRSGADLKEVEQFQAHIINQTMYMDKIVSDLQDYSRKMTPMVVEFDLYAFIEETINGMIPPRGVDIRVLRDPDVSSVRSDPMMLRRVVTNLLNNAFQAMPNGGVLTLRVRRDGMYWGVDIVDTGVGIPPESINSIFTPLFTTKPKGIGLGLSVVKRLIEALGGRVEFRSTVGVETTFTFWLPE